MINTDIKVGDVVQLNSGGPNMTVEDKDMYGTYNKALCIWFDGKGISSGRFPIECLSPPKTKRANRLR